METMIVQDGGISPKAAVKAEQDYFTLGVTGRFKM